MTTVTLQDAQAKLAELIHGLAPNEELWIVENDLPVARLIASSAKSARQLGTMAGSVLSMSADFDAPLDDFKEYSE